MWGNILRPQSQRDRCTHTHILIIFYLEYFILKTSPQTSPIQFFDPRPQSTVLKPKKKEFNLLNSDIDLSLILKLDMVSYFHLGYNIR